MSPDSDKASFLKDNVEQILLKPKKAFELLDISRSTGYAMIASGALPSVRIGRAVRVPVDGLREWVKRQTEKNGSAVNDSSAPS
jgi:excisionase family DNA binding protein